MDNTTLTHGSENGDILFWIDITTTSFLTLDCILRIVVSPHLKTLLKRYMFWNHLISVTSSWVVLYSHIYDGGHAFLEPVYMRGFFVLRCLRTLHVLRILHVIRGWEVLVMSLRDSMWEITVLAVLFVTGMVIFSTLMFYAEYSNPGSYPGIPIGLWWAIVTMTTVGYGDFYPTTPYGYVVGAACAITGMFVASLPIPVISENFSKMRYAQCLLDDYKQYPRTTNHPLDKRKGVHICHVCFTRAYVDQHFPTLCEEQITWPRKCQCGQQYQRPHKLLITNMIWWYDYKRSVIWIHDLIIFIIIINIRFYRYFGFGYHHLFIDS